MWTDHRMIGKKQNENVIPWGGRVKVDGWVWGVSQGEEQRREANGGGEIPQDTDV